MVDLAYTPVDEIEKIHDRLRNGFRSGKSKSVEYRKYQLAQLAYMVKDNLKRWEEALTADLGRPPAESHFLELGACITEIVGAWSSVDKWAKPEKPPFSLNSAPLRPVIYKEPKGVVLIISPFNYPMWLCISPFVGAITSGNAAVVKPSESSAHVAALFAELVPKYLDSDLFAVVNGAVPETTKLLDLPWDHILYTGSGRIGHIIATAAAKHLTPVSLELGGKSPVFVDPNCDLETTAKRILWGKVVNAGQTCVAPDYVLVPAEFQDKLVNKMKEFADQFYPESAKAPGACSRIIHAQALNRIKRLLDSTKGTIVFGGETDEATKFIAPTVVKDVKEDDSLMSEEIFGPVLPIIPVKDVEEAIAFVNARNHPLALYVFSNSDEYKKKVFSSTQSGACIANEVVLHPGIDGLPFGGIGPSGHGMHTGKYSFDMFTHLRASMDAPSWVDKLLGFRFPPYNNTDKGIKATWRLVKSVPPRPSGPPDILHKATPSSKRWGKWFFLALAIAVAAGLTKRAKILGALTR